ESPTDPHYTPTIIQPSTSQPQKKQRSRRPKTKDTKVPQPSGPTTNVIDEVVYEERDDSLERAATTATGLDAKQDSGNIDKTRSKATPNEPSSPGTSSGGGPRVPALETTKTTQANEITSLKKRVKKLERRKMSRTQGLKRLYKVGSSRRVESSKEEGLGEENASKQGRISDIDNDARITLVSTHFDADTDMFRVHDLDGDEVVVESEARAGEKRNVEEVVAVIDTASTIPVSTATTTTTTTVITDDEITLAKALAELKSAKSPTQTAIIPTPWKRKLLFKSQVQQQQQEFLHNNHHKQMFKTKAKLQVEFDKEVRLAREKAEKEQEANVSLTKKWDDIQSKIEADHELA
ncbi:hypothetical protein Tco_1356912, partial [Tanacetum coccineum]